ncbi:hypothetical protein BGZ79_011146 [Entomortierella chlamydospora]|nr:hypothetical protein BGZ79_011146 [Entomortierella chlamydospora]
MLRIGQHGGRRIISRAASIPSVIPSSTRHRFITTHARNDKISWTPSTTWFLGAGVVFTGVSLVLQSPSLGLSDCAVQNESPSSDPGKSTSLGARLAGYFSKKPQPIDQKDIVLDTDLTVTSWKQLEQASLVKVPGVVLWGSNKTGLVDPSGKSPGVIQIPQRLDAFQGTVLRDLKLGEDIAAAVDDQGDVYQWGSGYSSDAHQPEITLKNRDISSVALGDSKLFGLSKDGTHVYVMPKTRPTSGPTKAAIDYNPSSGGVLKYVGLAGNAHDSMTQLPVKDILQKGETITSFASGKNHLLMVTSEGRVLGSDDGLSVSLIGDADFRESRILEVACGEVHSLARDDQGRCWAWGTNGFGQLAQGAYSHANLRLTQPTLVKDIPGTAGGAECVKVAAGGNTSYVVIYQQNRFKVKSAGMGQWGQLGDGTAEKKLMPIGIHDLVIGSTHAFAVLDNAIVERTASSDDVVNHGRDVLSWGQNTYFQLLTGKRINRTEPIYALPLDSEILQPADKAIAAISQGGTPKKDTRGPDEATALTPTNRLQLLPAQNRNDVTSGKKGAKGDGEKVELKVVAGNGISAVFCKSVV